MFSEDSHRKWRMLFSLLFPPIGIVLLWATPKSLARKSLGTIGLLLWCLPISAGIIWLLMVFTGLQVEWRGGFPPVLTYSKTLPDYAAVERHRREQAAPPARARTNSQLDSATPYWTEFRGPRRDGHYDELPIATNWPPAGLHELWRQPVGGGYASFAIANGLAFTIEQRRDLEVATAYDLETGREIWTNGWAASFQESMGGDGPRATPTYAAGEVYVQGAQGELACLAARTGQRIWSKNILTDNGAQVPSYGVAVSPLVVDDLVIIQPGGPDGKSVVAYKSVDGAKAWTALSDGAAYGSPMLTILAGERQLLLVTATRAVGLDVKDGRLLWEHPWIVKMGNRNIAQPVILGTNRFLLSAGYGTGSEAVEIRRGNDGFTARTIWKNQLLKNKFTSSVYWNGGIYGLDEDILTCLDAETGERRWKDGRYDYGQLLLATGHLVILGGNGSLSLVRATTERREELARFPALHGKTWNQPAIAQGKLLVRNAVEMACFDLTGK